MEEVEAHEPSEHEHGTMLEVETVMENKLNFFKQEVHKEELARALQHVVGHLNEKQLMEKAQKTS